MLRHRRAREIVVFLGSLGAIGAVTAALKALPDVSPTTAALALLLVGAWCRDARPAQDSDRCLAPGDADAQLLLPASRWHAHHRRSAELDCVVRLSRRGGHCQQSVGGRAGSRPRCDRPTERSDTSLRSDPRRAADDGDGGRDRGPRPARRSSFRALQEWPSASLGITAGTFTRVAATKLALDVGDAQHRTGESARDAGVRCPSTRVRRPRACRTNDTMSSSFRSDMGRKRSASLPQLHRRSISAHSTPSPASSPLRSNEPSSWASATPRRSSVRRRTWPPRCSRRSAMIFVRR